MLTEFCMCARYYDNSLLVIPYLLLITIPIDDDDNDDDDSGGDSDDDDSHFIEKGSAMQRGYPAVQWLGYNHRPVLHKS